MAGATAVARHSANLAEAIVSVQQAKMAKTTMAPIAAKLKTWDKVASELGFTGTRVSTAMMKGVIAVLKAASYRSAESYLHAAIGRHMELHGPVPFQVALEKRQLVKEEVVLLHVFPHPCAGVEDVFGPFPFPFVRFAMNTPHSNGT